LPCLKIPPMSSLVQDLEAIRAGLENLLASRDVEEFERVLETVANSAAAVGRAWSGSWIGYQSRVYYEGLEPTPAGAHFSSEWGSLGRGHTGTWNEYDFDFVQSEVLRRAGVAGLDELRPLRDRLRRVFEEKRDEVLSVIHAMQSEATDEFLEEIRSKIKKLELPTTSVFVRALAPGSFFSRDSLAMSQGVQTPPHIAVRAEAAAIRSAVVGCRDLSNLTLKALSHFERLRRQGARSERVGTNVFIGHGRSAAWKDLRDFVRDRLRLPWDEFNRVPVAGITNVARLSEMLDAAAIALIVMTAEDEQGDGKLRARENVVHEAGLFQGRLGFTRAIVLVEEGCGEFSNIHGLGQIRFSPGQISAAFEELRRVMEREGLIPDE
jgi:predicted nucleotide-binding protein